MSTPLHATGSEKSPEMLALDKLVKERVLKGIEFLRTEYGEDWVEHIDMKTLRLEDGDCCVLGQVHPAYHPLGQDEDGLWEDEGYEAAVNMFGWNTVAEPASRGFIDTGEVTYGHLQKAWEEVIPDEQVRLERKRAMEAVKCGSSGSTAEKTAAS